MKPRRVSTVRRELQPAKLRELLGELLPIGDGAEPLSVTGWTRRGNFTRLRASYPNGSILTVHFNRAGEVSSCKGSLASIVVWQGDKA